jgi:CDP-paratose 2-epimerase
MLEAIEICEQISGRPLNSRYVEENRRGDHIWWISDLSRFREHYPEWKLEYNVPQILAEIFEFNKERWRRECATQANKMSSVS